MPKPGMSSVTLRDDVAELVRRRAAESHQGINDLITSALLGPSLGPSGTVPTPPIDPELPQNPIQITNPTQNNLQTPFPFSAGFPFAKGKSAMVRSPGFGPGSTAWKADEHLSSKIGRLIPDFALSWSEAHKDFVDYLQAQEYDARTQKDIISYLDRYSPVIRSPLDVNALFSKVTVAKRHVVLGLRILFNFYEALGVDKAFLDCLRKTLPHVECGVDLKIPVESKIQESLIRLQTAPLKYQALYNLLLDSGLREIEGIELIRNFEDAELVKGFRRCELAMFRGEKQAYYGHFTEYTLDLVKRARGAEMNEGSTSHYFSKYGYVMLKYLRKFAFDKMIELDVPESVADFIEGRVPKRIGAKHYMALARQASKFYPRYVRYLDRLRQRIALQEGHA